MADTDTKTTTSTILNARQIQDHTDGSVKKADDASNVDGNDHDDHHGGDDNDDWKLQLEASKQLGDQAFRAGQYTDSVQYYTAALALDPDSTVLYSNRSAAYLKMGYKSKALHDAQICVNLGGMGMKGLSRLAAAQQSLGRWAAAYESWKSILLEDAMNAAAVKGVDDCQAALEQERQHTIIETNNRNETATATISRNESNDKADDDVDKNSTGQEDDLLDEFFNDVEEATAAISKEKEEALQPKATNAIKDQKKDLGTAASQVERILQDNYKWLNLNPFHVFDMSHTSSSGDINRRYKALSLLLHPDKNPGLEQAQQAYDQVLNAKAKLDDENKANHIRQLIEQGLKHAKVDYEKRHGTAFSQDPLEAFERRAVQKIFAQVEYNRREAERRERNQEQRERQQEEEHLNKERDSIRFDRAWRQEDRVEKRIGSWRDFQNKKKKS